MKQSQTFSLTFENRCPITSKWTIFPTKKYILLHYYNITMKIRKLTFTQLCNLGHRSASAFPSWTVSLAGRRKPRAMCRLSRGVFLQLAGFMAWRHAEGTDHFLCRGPSVWVHLLFPCCWAPGGLPGRSPWRQWWVL